MKSRTKNEYRKKGSKDIGKKIEEFQKELMQLRAQLASGGSIDNPGKIKQLKRDIAALKTIQNELRE